MFKKMLTINLRQAVLFSSLSVVFLSQSLLANLNGTSNLFALITNARIIDNNSKDNTVKVLHSSVDKDAKLIVMSSHTALISIKPFKLNIKDEGKIDGTTTQQRFTGVVPPLKIESSKTYGNVGGGLSYAFSVRQVDLSIAPRWIYDYKRFVSHRLPAQTVKARVWGVVSTNASPSIYIDFSLPSGGGRPPIHYQTVIHGK